MGRRWHLSAGISFMQTIIIKSSRLRDSPFVDIIWVGLNNAVRDSFSRLSLPRRTYPWTLRLVRGQGRSQSPRTRFRDLANDIRRCIAQLSQPASQRLAAPPLFRVRVLLVASTWYDPLLIFRRSSAFILLFREAPRHREEKPRRSFSPLFTYMFFRDINRFL